MIDSIQLLNNLLNEKEEEYTRKKLSNFCTLLKDSKQCEEVIKIEFGFETKNI